MDPHMYGPWFLAVLLILAAPLVVIGVFALIFASLTRPSADRALRIEQERLTRREIDRDQLGVALHAL